MCLAIPAQVKKFISDDVIIADFGKGVTREVSIALMPEEIKIGDWILIHTGYAVSKMEPEEAKETLAMWEEIWKLQEEEKTSTG
ncbi:MAG: HypC/HybG/HupF family hydrogenase formation chaperone [Candidatus Heimdallarchaeota archaeon]|nr:MAG: HypC/HybG/HupF family hydrogenase formation chaperone [Candidatus Heimdallarchaeota archaeon]